MEGVSCAQFIFYNNFDSANLAKIEFVPQNESGISFIDIIKIVNFLDI